MPVISEKPEGGKSKSRYHDFKFVISEKVRACFQMSEVPVLLANQIRAFHSDLPLILPTPQSSAHTTPPIELSPVQPYLQLRPCSADDNSAWTR